MLSPHPKILHPPDALYGQAGTERTVERTDLILEGLLYWGLGAEKEMKAVRDRCLSRKGWPEFYLVANRCQERQHHERSWVQGYALPVVHRGGCEKKDGPGDQQGRMRQQATHSREEKTGIWKALVVADLVHAPDGGVDENGRESESTREGVPHHDAKSEDLLPVADYDWEQLPNLGHLQHVETSEAAAGFLDLPLQPGPHEVQLGPVRRFWA